MDPCTGGRHEFYGSSQGRVAFLGGSQLREPDADRHSRVRRPSCEVHYQATCACPKEVSPLQNLPYVRAEMQSVDVFGERWTKALLIKCRGGAVCSQVAGALAISVPKDRLEPSRVRRRRECNRRLALHPARGEVSRPPTVGHTVSPR